MFRAATPLFALALALIVGGPPAYAETDLPGSRDPDGFPRIADTTIVGYSHRDFDEADFVTGISDRALMIETIEGARTRIVYLAPQELAPFGILRNYQAAFEKIGQVDEVWSCRKDDCPRNLGGIFVWAKERQVPNNLGRRAQDLYINPSNYTDQVYWYGSVTSDTARYHISVYSAAITGEGDWLKKSEWYAKTKGHPLIHLDLVENVPFEPALEVVTAEEMSGAIAREGHIALYGIYFDFDSDIVKAESQPTLEQIAKVLEAEATLNVYIVGHTDNQGSVEYNRELSLRRAKAVVKALRERHGTAEARMIPLGVGLAAPVASNDTEAGRAKNRRVELVKQ